jgi:hypothetical protein
MRRVWFVNGTASVQQAGLGTFHHFREPTPLEKQNVIRMNRDTLYSLSVFDLDAGPVTITLPDAGQRFLSLQVIDEDHYTPAVVYGAGSYTFTREKIGTRYVTLGVRILVNPADPEDLKQVHALQDAMTVTQPGGPGRFDVPHWDQVSQKKVRDALLALAETLPDTKRTFGARDQVDPVRHLIGTAFAFGGNPEKDALYLNVTPSKNDGTTVYRLTVKDVPVDAFSGRSSSTTPRVTSKKTHSTLTRSTTPRQRETRMVRSPSSSAVAMVGFQTACRPCRAGTTWCGSIVRALKS